MLRLVRAFLATSIGDPLGKGMYGINTNVIRAFFSDLEYTEDDAVTTESYMLDLIDVVDHAMNQEFLRLRTAGLYNTNDYNYSSNELCFRIGSVYYNWFDVIWKVVYENRDRFATVTIVTDEQAGRPFKFYIHDGKVMNKFPVEEFILLSGNPVFEKLSVRQSLLLEGLSIFDACTANTHWMNSILQQEVDSYLCEPIWVDSIEY